MLLLSMFSEGLYSILQSVLDRFAPRTPEDGPFDTDVAHMQQAVEPSLPSNVDFRIRIRDTKAQYGAMFIEINEKLGLTSRFRTGMCHVPSKFFCGYVVFGF